MSLEHLNLKGIPCPMNAARALIKIATMMEGEILEILIDDGEPIENVPPSLVEQGHIVKNSERIDLSTWKLVVVVGC